MYQKPGADVQLLTSHIHVDDMDMPAFLPIVIRSGYSGGKMVVAIPDSVAGLEIVSGVLESEFILAGSSSEYTIPLSVYVSSPGRHYIPLNVIVDLPDGMRTQRSLSVIISVGQKEALLRSNQLDASLEQLPSGQIVRPLDATEELITK
jgi:hypothetical protein